MFLTILADTTDAATNTRLTFVVLAQILRVRQYSFQELQRNDLNFSYTTSISQRSLILHLVDTTHSDILNHLKVLQILLSEGHPETGTLDSGIVDD